MNWLSFVICINENIFDYIMIAGLIYRNQMQLFHKWSLFVQGWRMHTALICGDSPADSKLFEKKRKKKKKKLVLLFSHGTRVKFLLLQLLLRVQGTRVEIVLHTHSSSCRSVCVRHTITSQWKNKFAHKSFGPISSFEVGHTSSHSFVCLHFSWNVTHFHLMTVI